MLSRLALEHLLGALCALILHHSCEVAVCDPAPHEGLDVDLLKAGRVERNPARLLEVLVAKRRAKRRLGERHRSAGALGVALCEPEGDHEVEQLKELGGHTTQDALGLGGERSCDALLACDCEPLLSAIDLAVRAPPCARRDMSKGEAVREKAPTGAL